MIISNDTFAVHFVEAEVRGDGEDSEEAEHEAHGGGGQQGGEAAAEAVVMALLTDPGHPSMHTAVIPWVFTPGESFTIVCCLSYSMQKSKSDKSCCTAPDCGDCRLAAVTTTRADLEKPTLL